MFPSAYGAPYGLKFMIAAVAYFVERLFDEVNVENVPTFQSYTGILNSCDKKMRLTISKKINNS